MNVIRTHGRGGYRAGCRCEICRPAAVAAAKENRRRHVEAAADGFRTARAISEAWAATVGQRLTDEQKETA